MQKQRATFTLDPDVLRATRVQAARAGKRDSEVVEEALRKYLLSGVLEEIWSNLPEEIREMSEDEVMALVVAEQHAMRAERKRKPDAA